MTPRARKRLLNLFRVAVCVAALWFVARGVTWSDQIAVRDDDGGTTTLTGRLRENDDAWHLTIADGASRLITAAEIALDESGAPMVSYGLRSAWSNSRKSLLIVSVLIYLPVAFLLAQRFRILLRAQAINLAFGDCVRLTFAGNFLNYATPLGSNAGDLVKAWFAAQHTPHKTEAFATVVLDRIIGLGTLILVAVAITALSPGESRVAVLRPYMLTLLAIGVGGAAAYFSPWAKRLSVPSAWLERFPVLRHIERIDRAVRTLARARAILVWSVVLTVILQVFALGSYFVVAAAMGMRANAGNLLEFFAYFYTGAMVQALPGPPQGLGTVELAYRYFFAPYGSPSQIVCMALAIRLVGFLCSLPGMLVTMTGSYKPRDFESDIARLNTSERPGDHRSDSQSSEPVMSS